MFDKLIASDAEGANFKNRRSHFMVSFVVVGVLFLAALVIDIFASDFGLGKGGIELTELVAPPDMVTAEPERPRPSMPATPARSTSLLPTRQANIAPIDVNPIVPQNISVVPNTQQVRPDGRFFISKFDTNPDNSNGSGRDNNGIGSNNSGLARPQEVADSRSSGEAPPPVKIPVKNPPTQTLGVINGRASYLPKPAYPASALAVNAQGTVDVQVIIDESGKVISAHAVSGNPLLRNAAELAARNARFSPTLLSNIPVKVTGVIVYNFMRS